MLICSKRMPQGQGLAKVLIQRAASVTLDWDTRCKSRFDATDSTACAEHGSPFDLMRAAYHLGNRHVPIELQADHLKIEPDHVLAELMRNMHMTVTEVQEPFEPEGGAYGDNAMMGHDHGHGHAHGHAHGHGHPHAH